MISLAHRIYPGFVPCIIYLLKIYQIVLNMMDFAVCLWGIGRYFFAWADHLLLLLGWDRFSLAMYTNKQKHYLHGLVITRRKYHIGEGKIHPTGE